MCMMTTVLAIKNGSNDAMGAPIVYAAICLLLILGLLSIVYYTVRNGISPMPSSGAARKAVAEEVQALVRAGWLSEQDTILDAGSGWGHLAFCLARRFPQMSVIGVENSPIPLIAARIVRGLAVYPNVEFKRGNLFHAAYSDAKLIVCYLYPGAMQPLQRTVEKALMKNETIRECWLLSVGFALPHVPAARKTICRDLYRTPIYLYRLPAPYLQENTSNSR